MDNIVINVTENNELVSIDSPDVIENVVITASPTQENIYISVTQSNENVLINAESVIENVQINAIGTDYTKPASKNPSFTYASGRLVRIDYASDTSYKLLSYSGAALNKIEHFLSGFTITKNLFYNLESKLSYIQEIIS